MSSELPQTSHYILLRTTPPVDELALRQALHDAVAQAFGLTAATHLDVLWVKSPPAAGTDARTGRGLVRVDSGEDATRVLAAIVASAAAPRMKLVKASSFLPSLLVDETPI
ncbi:hypothetical protein B0H17DRAFT_1326714 [Mycena rosella]|uniref:Uncharacterized protein n=1 Tax=Mycena rosella TaxID=1033263 RepID=A0AAD7M6V0_MYCRO|nr:hypothetical protein B0H17DRAFT_1326714 [Mycena rosella]